MLNTSASKTTGLPANESNQPHTMCQISDQWDYQHRTNPQLMTRLLRKSVPVLAETDWSISEVGYGYCETILPLNDATTNQHGTHQAALISLSGDYTGGMALASLLKGVPIAGVHPADPGSVSLWLASMEVKYLKPSTGHLTGKCEVPTALAERLVHRYQQGKRILASLPMTFESNGDIVATAEMKYFAQPTAQLLDCSQSISPLFANKLKASARMIAGVRATAQPKTIELRNGEMLRLDSPQAEIVAGPHGMLLAKRLQNALPQLSDLVMARDTHIDQMIDAMQSVEQIVLVGAGLDMRPFRFALSRKSTPIDIFELDLPEMLDERQRVVDLMPKTGDSYRRHCIPSNFLRDDVGAKLMQSPPFDPHKTTALIYEGCSMYFDAATNQRIIASLANTMRCSHSRLWIDFVHQSIVAGGLGNPQIDDFLARMTELGESFVFGVNDPGSFLSTCGLKNLRSTTAGEYLNRTNRPADVYNQYWFTESAVH